MRHYQNWEKEEKLKAWLELCDFSFELFLQGIKLSNTTDSAEEIVWHQLTEIRKKYRLSNRKILIRMKKCGSKN